MKTLLFLGSIGGQEIIIIAHADL